MVSGAEKMLKHNRNWRLIFKESFERFSMYGCVVN